MRILGGFVVLAAVAALAFYIRSVALPPPPFSTLILGWDGSRLEQVENMLKDGRLPFLKEFSESDSFIRVRVNDGRSDTKAGWSQIFTGYDAAVTGVHSNRNYRPIPPGFTVFERLKSRYGDQIFTAFLSGKVNNIGSRGPHQICVNCKSRFDENNKKTKWWDESSDAPPRDGEEKKLEPRDGEPYFHAAPKMDKYVNGLEEASNVAREALKVIQANCHKKFFAFVHFEEPDEQGHLYREGSSQYIEALRKVDSQSRDLIKTVMTNCPGPLRVFILSDHGFNKGEDNHRDAPEMFWASSEKGLAAQADRRDFTPTILRMYDFPLGRIKPALNGSPIKK